MRIPATGLQAARTLLDVHAHNVANVSTDGFRAQRAELRAIAPRGGVEVAAIGEREPDLVEDVVGLVTAKTMYAANAKALAVMAETERRLLDVRA
ncbi:MAG: flagellar basal body protein [Actinomycetota bacterium]|nr:flagellar basal body protein [Actinomycetota bacterium]MDQ5809000.1 flagellar basal body protein [Actinomycetota bacterium]